MASDLALRRMDEDARRKMDLETAEKVHELRVKGVPYTEISKRLGTVYGTTIKLHTQHLDRLRALEELGATEVSRRLQEERYEALLATMWGRAMIGDINAVRECRLILDSIDARSEKITAMVTRSSGDGSVTLVASGSTEEYIKALRELSG